jgi:hypothetical protein
MRAWISHHQSLNPRIQVDATIDGVAVDGDLIDCVVPSSQGIDGLTVVAVVPANVTSFKLSRRDLGLESRTMQRDLGTRSSVEVTPQGRVAFSTGEPIAFRSLPDEFNEGIEIVITADAGGIKLAKRLLPGTQFKSGGLVYQSGPTGATVEKKVAVDYDFGPGDLDGVTLRIGPNLKISIGNNETIVAGPSGARLKRKTGAEGLFLVDGEAYLTRSATPGPFD